MKLFILALTLTLGGCAFHPEQDKPAPSLPAPPLMLEGPRFAPTALQCAAEPVPPDPAGDLNRQGSAAALDREALAQWGRGCKGKLESVGRRLNAAGLVER